MVEANLNTLKNSSLCSGTDTAGVYRGAEKGRLLAVKL
jgi:hypothetical protein